MKKILAILYAGLLVGSLTACSATTSSSESSPSPSSSSQTVIIGKVSSIDGDTITLALLQNNMPSNNDTAGSSGNGHPDNQAAPSGSAPSGAPAGNNDSIPSGTPPQGSGNMPNGGYSPGGRYTETGESQTITVTSDTIITIVTGDTKTVGSISDIAVGDILYVTMNGDTVASVDIASSAPSSADTATNSTSTSGDTSTPTSNDTASNATTSN